MLTLQNSLKGLRILNTRPKEQNEALSGAIRAAGGIALDVPMLTIEPTPLSWCTAMPPLPEVDHAIFISSNAVHYYFTALKTRDITWHEKIQVTAIGRGSAQALTERGIRVDHIPSIADSEHLLELDALNVIDQQSILLIKGEGGRPTIAATLLERGGHLISLSVYRRGLPQYNQADINSLWRENAVDIILFTSQESMHNLFTVFGSSAHTWICQTPCIVISHRLAQIAQTLGIQTVINSDYNTIVQTLKGFVHDNTP